MQAFIVWPIAQERDTALSAPEAALSFVLHAFNTCCCRIATDRRILLVCYISEKGDNYT